MKKLVIIFLLLSSTTCWGEWTYLGGYTQDHGTTYAYYDKSRIKRTGSSVYVWELRNSKKINKEFGYRSAIFYSEYDCDVGRLRILTTQTYKGSMGTNPIKLQYQLPKDWIYPTPNSIVESYMKIFCS